MAQTNVKVLKEVFLEASNNWKLCFQWCLYVHPDRDPEYGYRFIWRRDDGTLQGARGQARIPSLRLAEKLIEMAREEGWGELIAEDEDDFE